MQRHCYPGPSRKAMNQLRNISEVGPPGPVSGKGEGLGSPRALTEAVFPLPTQSEEKIGADRLGDLASLVEFNPESTVMVSCSSSHVTSHSMTPSSLIRAHHHSRTLRNGTSSIQCEGESLIPPIEKFIHVCLLTAVISMWSPLYHSTRRTH